MDDEIKQLATRMRGALEKYIETKPHMKQATGGFCVVAAKALGQILNASGYLAADVRGKFEGQEHAWVETQGKIVDITQDQFGGHQRVFVTDIGDERYEYVSGDEEFDRDLGVAGDDQLWSYIDEDGNECPFECGTDDEGNISATGTRNSVVREVLDLFGRMFGGDA